MLFAILIVVTIAVFVGSQIYWYARARALVKRLVETRTARTLLAAAGLAAYLALFAN
jgi:divalent metal cation (Fe/Co/Zn/Cd) transporter